MGQGDETTRDDAPRDGHAAARDATLTGAFLRRPVHLEGGPPAISGAGLREMSEEFKPGDFVQHKLGGEVMAVKKMNGERIRTWVDVDNSVRKESFTAADLRVVEDRKD